MNATAVKDYMHNKLYISWKFSWCKREELKVYLKGLELHTKLRKVSNFKCLRKIAIY